MNRTRRFNSKRLLFRLGLGVVLVVLLFSVIPYLIRPAVLEGDRYAFAFAESHFAVVENTELHYRLWDDGGSTRGNVLLVHGFGGSTFSWRFTAPALQQAGYRVVAMDLPGFGLSERRVGLDHSQRGRAELLWALLNQLAPGESWHLIGHSMGGGTIATMALAQPAQTVSTVYAAGSVALEDTRPASLLLRYPPAVRWIKVLAARLMQREENITRLVNSAYGRPATAEEVTGYYQPVIVTGSDTVLLDLQQRQEVSIARELDQLTVPALCIWGEKDSWVPLAQGERLAELLEARLEVIPGEGHCPMETAPEAFNQILLRYLGGSNNKIEVSITSERNGWSPFMSSIPGLPLNATIKPSLKGENVKYHWVSEQGTFLSWEESQIIILGKDILTSEQKVYWSLDSLEEIEASSFKIYLLIEDNDSSKVIAQTSIQLEQKEGFFSIKN